MFGDTSKNLAKCSIEFNDLAVQMRPHRIAYLRLLGRPYTILYMRRSVGRLAENDENEKIWFNDFFCYDYIAELLLSNFRILEKNTI